MHVCPCVFVPVSLHLRFCGGGKANCYSTADSVSITPLQQTAPSLTPTEGKISEKFHVLLHFCAVKSLCTDCSEFLPRQRQRVVDRRVMSPTSSLRLQVHPHPLQHLNTPHLGSQHLRGCAKHTHRVRHHGDGGSCGGGGRRGGGCGVCSVGDPRARCSASVDQCDRKVRAARTHPQFPPRLPSRDALSSRPLGGRCCQPFRPVARS